MEEGIEELNNLLMRVKEETEKVGLKLNIQKTKIMASGPTTSWQIEGEKVEVVTKFLFLGSKITQMVTAVMKSEDNCFPAKKQSSSDFMPVVTIPVILEPKKRKLVTVSTFSPSICHEVWGLDAMILVFLIFSLKPALSHHEKCQAG